MSGALCWLPRPVTRKSIWAFYTFVMACCQTLHMLVAEAFRVMSSRRQNTLGSSPNKHVLRLACAWSVPLAVVQIIIAWVSLGFQDDVDLQHSNSVLHHFFAPYSEGTPSECGTANRCHTWPCCVCCMLSSVTYQASSMDDAGPSDTLQWMACLLG